MSPGVLLSAGQLSFSLGLIGVAGIGVGDWSFGLDYQSGFGLDGPLGPGFNFTQNASLSVEPDGTVVFTGGNNTQAAFAPTATGYSSAGNNTASVLTRQGVGTPSETFTLTSRGGTVAVYSGVAAGIAAPGQLLSVTDRFGTGEQYAWVNSGGVPQLAAVTDGYGRTATYTYAGSGALNRLQQVQDYQGRQVNFQYDAQGRLTAVVLPSVTLAAAGNTFPNGTAYVFAYDSANPRPQRQDDLVKVWYPNQTQAFVGSGRTVDVAGVYGTPPRYVVGYGQDPTDTDLWGRVVSVAAGGTGVGGTALYSYTSNVMDLPVNQIDPADPIVFEAVVQDRNGNVSYYDFNANGMPARVRQTATRSKLTVTPPLESTSWVTWTKYNAHNQPLAIVYPEGNCAQYTYEDGNVPGLGFWPARLGLMLSQTATPGNTFGIPATRAVPAGTQTARTSRYFYDPYYNQLCASIEPRGNPWQAAGTYFTPQNGGATPTDADRSRYATVMTFDYQENAAATVHAYFAAQFGISSTQTAALVAYVDGQMKATAGTGGLPAGFPLDLGDINGDGQGNGSSSGLPIAPMQGNVSRVQYPSCTPIGGSSPTQARSQLFTVNLKGQTTTVTDAEGNVSAYVRYTFKDPNGTGTPTPGFNPPDATQQYGFVKTVTVDVNPYNVMSLVGAAGDLPAFVVPRPLPGGVTRTNTPGVYQALVTQYEGGGASGGAGCASCAYDELGNATAVTDPRGFTWTTERNEVGQAFRTVSPPPYNFAVETYYDANGNVTRVDTQDWQVQYDSTSVTDPGYGHFTPTGGGYQAGTGPVGSGATGYSAVAEVPMVAGPGGSVRSGWFTNLYHYNVLDWKTEDDIDATGSTPASLVTTYGYDANGNLTIVTKPEGNTVRYDYDERDLRIAMLVGAAPGQPLPGGGSLIVYWYDNNGMLGSVVGPAARGGSGNQLTVTLADPFHSGGPALAHTGDWVVQNGYDGYDRVLSSTDAAGNVTAYAFDPTGRTVRATASGPVGGATPPSRAATNNVLLSQSISRFNEAGRPYEQQQDVFVAGGTTLPSGRTVTHTNGGLASNSAGNGHTGTFALYPVAAGASTYVLTQTAYDHADRPTRTLADLQPGGATTTHFTAAAYDGAGRSIQVTDPMGNATGYAYDNGGNVVQTTTTERCTLPGVTTTESFSSATFYDCLGRPVVTATQGADGSFAPLLSTADSYATPASPTLFAMAGYDSRGNTALTVDANGNSTISDYDGTGRLLETDELLRANGQGGNGPVAGATFAPSGHGLVRTQRVYDGNGRLTTLTDDNGNVTHWAYDRLDRQVTMTFADGSVRISGYNAAGDVTSYTDENGSAFAVSFDQLGRRTAVAIMRATGVGGTTAQSFQFDGLGRMTQAVDTSPVTTATNTFCYDSIGRTVEESSVAFGNAAASTTHTQLLSYAVQQLTYPSGWQITNAYDLIYRRVAIGEGSNTAGIAAWAFFGPGRLAQVALGNGITCSYMNNDGTHGAVQTGVPNPPWNSSSPSPMDDRLGYDGVRRLTAKRYISSPNTPGATLVVGFTADHDRPGNKACERHLHAPDRSHLYRPVSPTGTVAAGYDSLDRLTRYQRGTLAATGGVYNAGGGSIATAIGLPGTVASRTYNLDGLGNWQTTAYVPEGTTTLTTEVRQHNAVNELTAFGPTGGTLTPVAYDHGNNAANPMPTIAARGNGNIVNDATRAYAYDALNRLIDVGSAANVSAGWAAYSYDALGRRIRKVVTNGGMPGNAVLNGTTDFLYDGSQVVEDRLNGTTATAHYVWGRYIDELIQQRIPTTSGFSTFYLLSDLLYRSVALTDSSGRVVEAYDADAYGMTLCYDGPGPDGLWFTDDDRQTTTPQNRYLFTGRELDSETGLYYYRARYYHPLLGRFVGRDSIWTSNGSLYTYCWSRPTQIRDPSGRIPDICLIVADPPPADSDCVSPYDDLKTDKEICDKAKKLIVDPRKEKHPNEVLEGLVICSDKGKKKTPCQFHVQFKNKPGTKIKAVAEEPDSAARIIERCLLEHEKVHVNSPRGVCPCKDPWRQKEPHVSEKDRELPAYEKQKSCLEQGLKDCKGDDDCISFVQTSLSNVKQSIEDLNNGITLGDPR